MAVSKPNREIWPFQICHEGARRVNETLTNQRYIWLSTIPVLSSAMAEGQWRRDAVRNRRDLFEGRNWTKRIAQILIILVPCYLVAFITDKMVYVVPTLAATLIVSRALSLRIDDDHQGGIE